MTSLPPQRLISASCEEDLVRYGDSWRGAGYKSEQEAEERYTLMLSVVREKQGPLSVLDVGCGFAHMLDHIQRHAEYRNIRYTGLDISSKYLSAAKARHPQADFILMDVLESDVALAQYDYVLMNGLFNYRGPIDQDSMQQYWQQLVSVVYSHCRCGIAFNVMSKIVDWERDELFHLPFDTMARFIAANLSRWFVIRHDYRAYEYTTYVYRNPNAS